MAWGDHAITRIRPFADRGQGQTIREFGRDILHGVHGQVRFAVKQRLLEFLDKQSFAADCGQGVVQDLVALRLHPHQFRVQAMLLGESLGHQFSLPDRQRAAPSGDAANGRVHEGRDTNCTGRSSGE